MATNYRYLTNSELIRHLTWQRTCSPVIEELCLRLEAVPDDELVSATLDRSTCPVCRAEVTVAVDQVNNTCKLEPLR